MKTTGIKSLQKIALLIVVLLVIGALAGCRRNEETEEPEEHPEEVIEEEEEEEEEEVIVPEFRSPLSGLPMEEEDMEERRIFGVMYDNNPRARPHAGLIDAEMVYEMNVEGGATRYLALFYMEEPELIGPVRSTRPYYLRKILEYDGIFVHAGAARAVTNQLISYGINNVSLLGPGPGAFWRESHRSAPHNAYTSSERVLSTAENLGYHKELHYEGPSFHWPGETPEGEEVQSFEVIYHSSYRSSYEYDEESETYLRYYVDEPHVDEVTGEHISMTNVIVQIIPQWRIEGASSGIIEMQSVGEGTGYYFSMGKMVPITWEKDDDHAPTRYFLESGEPLTRNPGKTWVQVIGSEERLTIHETENEGEE